MPMRWNIPTFTSLAFLSIFDVAGASPTVYDVDVSGHDAFSTVTLSGTITVADGKFGLLSSGDIVSYDLQTSGSVSASVQSINFEGPGHVIITLNPPECGVAGIFATGTCGFFATPTQLIFTNEAGRSMSFILGIGNSYVANVVFNPDSITAGQAIGCGFGPPCEQHSGVLHVVAPYVVGTAVPEPTHAALIGIGLLWLALAWKQAKTFREAKLQQRQSPFTSKFPNESTPGTIFRSWRSLCVRRGF